MIEASNHWASTLSAKGGREPSKSKTEDQKEQNRKSDKRRRDRLKQEEPAKAERLLKALYEERFKAKLTKEANGCRVSNETLEPMEHSASENLDARVPGAGPEGLGIPGPSNCCSALFDQGILQGEGNFSFFEPAEYSSTPWQYDMPTGQMLDHSAFGDSRIVLDPTMTHPSLDPYLQPGNYMTTTAQDDFPAGPMLDRQATEDPQMVLDQTTTYQQDQSHPAPPFMVNHTPDYHIPNINQCGFEVFNQSMEPMMDPASFVQSPAPRLPSQPKWSYPPMETTGSHLQQVQQMPYDPMPNYGMHPAQPHRHPTHNPQCTLGCCDPHSGNM
jgi:hypothetical protein